MHDAKSSEHTTELLDSIRRALNRSAQRARHRRGADNMKAKSQHHLAPLKKYGVQRMGIIEQPETSPEDTIRPSTPSSSGSADALP